MRLPNIVTSCLGLVQVHCCNAHHRHHTRDVCTHPRLNPYAEHTYDGLPLNPLEVMFVKVKDFQVEGDWMSTLLATTYDRWLELQVRL